MTLASLRKATYWLFPALALGLTSASARATVELALVRDITGECAFVEEDRMVGMGWRGAECGERCEGFEATCAARGYQFVHDPLRKERQAGTVLLAALAVTGLLLGWYRYRHPVRPQP